ncbi:MATH domain and coiled-coil domain-containing protein At3g58410 isoform X1 [Capsella rubella]|uniref:MATH domain and coiled-coil domain-containing protein At3g58410 isoform X1 n=1 Tax=Capsella rubella TaxID=81985 RepID=UPI000CD56C88|nr:MATH domain and coiled-coil domain-containing protein At3g58410 isoform X1 [Capsella rubella]
MAKQDGKKIVWVIKNFSSLQSEECIYSDPVLIGDCKWRLCACPKGDGNIDNYFYLFVEVADDESLPSGWKRFVKFQLNISQPGKSVVSKRQVWFDNESCSWGFQTMIPLTKLHDKKKGFVVDGELTIVASVDVLEVIGTLDASEESIESSRPLKKMKLSNDDNNVEASSVKESIVVNGFQVLSSQVESVRCIFERHPDIAVDFRAKSQHIRTTCMSFLLSLIETLCKSLEEISNEDFVDANIALTCLKDVNFKVDWLEKKLDQVKENKEKEQSALAQLQETEESILKLKQKAEEQKAVLLATRTTLSFDDVV